MCFKKATRLQLLGDWILPKVNFFHSASCNQVQEDGDVLKFCHWIIGTDFDDEQTSEPISLPHSPSHPQQFGPGAHGSNDSGKASVREKKPSLVSYTQVNSLKVTSPRDGPDFPINWPCLSSDLFLLTVHNVGINLLEVGLFLYDFLILIEFHKILVD